MSVFSSPITNPGAGKTAAAPELVPSCFRLKEKRLPFLILHGLHYSSMLSTFFVNHVQRNDVTFRLQKLCYEDLQCVKSDAKSC